MKNKLRKIIALTFSLIMITNMISCEKNEKAVAISKGSYVEERYVIPPNIKEIMAVNIIDDGSIEMIAGNEEKYEVYSSNNQGETWQIKEEMSLQEDSGEDIGIFKCDIADNGDIFLMYFKFNNENENQENFDFEYKIVKSDGSNLEINEDDIKDDSISEDDLYSYKFAFNKNNELVCLSANSEIYILENNTGKVKAEYSLTDSIASKFALGKEVLIANTINGTKEYDIESGEEKEELKELQKLIASDDSFEGSTHGRIFIGKDDNIVYLSSLKGLYRYVIGGNMVEQLVEGSKTSLGNDESQLMDIREIDTGEFIAAYTDYSGNEGKSYLVKYYFDENASSNSENEITIYSLYNDYSINQAIVNYQKENSNVQVTYEVGISEESGITENDAIRTLITEIMADKGPDIILADNLNINSFIEQGLFEDMSDIFLEYIDEDKIFKSIVNSFKKDDKIYTMPLRITILAICGQSQYIDKVNDLNSLTEVIKSCGNETNKKVIDVHTPAEIVSLLYKSNGESWIEDDKLNEENIRDFLSCGKEIYEVIRKAYSDKEYQEYITDQQQYGENNSWYLNGGLNGLTLLVDNYGEINIGNISDFYTLGQTTSANQYDNSITYKLLNGTSKNVFSPNEILAINSKSNSKDAAKQFVKAMFNVDMQIMESNYGFPVNKEAYNKMYDSLKGKRKDGVIATTGYENKDGSVKEFEIKVSSEKEKDSLAEAIENLTTPVFIDNQLIDIISKNLELYINNEATLEEAVNNVKQSLEIKLTE